MCEMHQQPKASAQFYYIIKKNNNKKATTTTTTGEIKIRKEGLLVNKDSP